jgi:hypothetical protein
VLSQTGSLPNGLSFVDHHDGTATLSGTATAAGTRSLTFTAGNGVGADAVQSFTLTVAPAAVSTFTVTGLPVSAGVAGQVTVTAQDRFANTVTSYSGTIHFVSSDPLALLPADYTFNGTDAGRHTFSLMLRTAGNQSVRVQDGTSLSGQASAIVGTVAGNNATIAVNTGSVVQLTASAGMTFDSAQKIPNPHPSDAPPGVTFPLGFLEFSVHGSTPGSPSTVTITLPAGLVVNTYYKYGPTLGNPAPHWYNFAFNGVTGAEFRSGQVILHFVDGLRGDNDLTANGVIADPGTPALDPQASYVTQLYQTVLGRAPDDAGLSYWMDRVTAGATRLQIAQGFWESAEHRGLQVDQFYAKYLHRAAEPDGRAYWIDRFQAGLHETEVAGGFLFSLEYQSTHATLSSFVTGLYADVLGRAATASESAYWLDLGQQANGPPVLAAAITGFLKSREANLQQIDHAYGDLLGRSANSDERAFWLAVLQQDQGSEPAIAPAFLASDEFFARLGAGEL